MANLAAVILAAGRGTRMKDNSHNKVCFDCAGIPVIRRIVLNMRAAGVQQIVVVVGHMAQDVMDALDGIEGIVYVYQKVQNGTGSAALVGMKALKSMGFSGSVFVSVGDKIISVSVLKAFITKAKSVKAVYGVQPKDLNFAGGRIALRDDKPYGIYELTEAAMLKILPEPRDHWIASLQEIGLNSSKAEKVLKKAAELTDAGEWDGQADVVLAGEAFTADELLNSPYTNMSLYCFDLEAAVENLQKCTPRNAQGEIYLTDTMAFFTEKGEAELYVVDDEEDVLTYSTKPELIAMSRHFMRNASEQISRTGDRKDRLLKAFIDKFGDQKVVYTRAPGRVIFWAGT